MKKIILSSVACATLMFAANSEYKYEITPMVGGVFSEGDLKLDRNYADVGLAIGFNQKDSFIDQVEVGFLTTPEDVKYKDTIDVAVTRVFTNLIKEYPLSTNFSLYGLAGAGVELFYKENDLNNDGPFFNYGAGVKYKLAERLSVKFDLRHVVEVGQGFDNNLLYTLGLSVPFGKVTKTAPVAKAVAPVATPKDSDKDGVIDSKDKCPNTIVGVKVDENGCELDDDKDGVVNRLDKCPNTMEGAKVDAQGCISLVDLKINFDINSAKISNSYSSRIAKFAEVLKSNPKLKATIKAYTDATGTEKYNQKLSEKRAAATVKALKALKVDTKRLKAVGYGETNPIATNKTKEGRAANRRVTAVINK